MTAISCTDILEVPKMPQDIREGLLRTIRLAQVARRVRLLEEYEWKQQGTFLVATLAYYTKETLKAPLTWQFGLIS